MKEAEVEARAFLQEFQTQPEEVRRVFLYVVCQTMFQAGLLDFLGAFTSPGAGVTLVYRNPDTGEVFEIVKPDISREEEQAVHKRIGELLRDNAQAV